MAEGSHVFAACPSTANAETALPTSVRQRALKPLQPLPPFFVMQLLELSSVKAALRNQEGETERWKKEAGKVGVREKDARRALESARIASTAAARR